MKEFGLLHTLKEHKAAVHDIAVHKSGKILVSVSKDKRLIIWNLINASKAFSMNLKYSTPFSYSSLYFQRGWGVVLHINMVKIYYSNLFLFFLMFLWAFLSLPPPLLHELQLNKYKKDAYKVEITERHIITMSDFDIHVIDQETN